MTRSHPSLALALAGLLIVGCGGGGPARPASQAARADDGRGPLTAVIVDASASTQPLRAPGGQWEQEWLDVARATADKQGVLWATTADGNAVSRSLWTVRGQVFKPTIDDNALLAKAELKRQAEDLRSADRRIMAVRGHGGSDLLGALQVAARLFHDYPNRPRNLVLLTDGGIAADGVNLIYRPPATGHARTQLIERLRADGRLPDLSGGAGPKPRVWIGGIGHGSEREMTPEVSRDIIAFWEALLPAANAELVSADSASLRLVGFP